MKFLSFQGETYHVVLNHWMNERMAGEWMNELVGGFSSPRLYTITRMIAHTPFALQRKIQFKVELSLIYTKWNTTSK